MSVLVVGISHKSAPVELLEKIALDSESATKLIQDVMGGEHVSEATAIVTCNRLEVYAEVDRFHGSVEDLSGLLVARAEQSTEAGGTWWDVAIAEVSGRDDVRQARALYDEQVRKVRQ